jgi:hypothetical protein
MNINRKLEIAKQTIDSIATHVDKDSNIRKSALESLKSYMEDWNVLIDFHTESEIKKELDAG